MDGTVDLSGRLLGLLEGIQGISVAVLFGSRAGGRPRPESDLDIALLPSKDSREPRRKLQARVASVLGELSPEGRVDVVFLDEAPELLRQRILETGSILIQRDPVRWKEIRRATMREHGDREPYRRILRMGQKRRILEGGFGHGRP